MDEIFVEFELIYATGKPSDSFEATYAAIYEACANRHESLILESRLIEFYNSKLEEIHDHCCSRDRGGGLSRCSSIKRWLTKLHDHINVCHEISDLLLYYNRSSRTHSLDLGYYLTACYLLDIVSATGDPESESEPGPAASEPLENLGRNYGGGRTRDRGSLQNDPSLLLCSQSLEGDVGGGDNLSGDQEGGGGGGGNSAVENSSYIISMQDYKDYMKSEPILSEYDEGVGRCGVEKRQRNEIREKRTASSSLPQTYSHELIDWLIGKSADCESPVLLENLRYRSHVPIWDVVSHTHHCLPCLKLFVELNDKLTSVLKNWPNAFLAIYKTYLKSEWRNFYRTLLQGSKRRNLSRRFSSGRKRRSGFNKHHRPTVQPVVDRMVDDDDLVLQNDRSGDGPHDNTTSHTSCDSSEQHLSSHASLNDRRFVRSVMVSPGENLIRWFMHKSLKALKLEQNFVNEFPMTVVDMGRIIDDLWTEIFLKNNLKILRAIDWSDPTRLSLVRQCITWFGLSIKSWIELSSYLREHVLNEIFEEIIMKIESSESGPCPFEDRMFVVMSYFRDLLNISHNQSFRNLLKQSMADYFITHVSSEAARVLIEPLLEASRASPPADLLEVIQEYSSFIKLDVKGKSQNTLINIILELEASATETSAADRSAAEMLTADQPAEAHDLSLAAAAPPLCSVKDQVLQIMPFSDARQLLQMIEVVYLIPNELRIITMPHFHHKTSRSIRVIPVAATQLRKWCLRMSVLGQNKILEHALDSGRCVFTRRAGGGVVECSTGAGIILDVWSHLESNYERVSMNQVWRETGFSNELFKHYINELKRTIPDIGREAEYALTPDLQCEPVGDDLLLHSPTGATDERVRRLDADDEILDKLAILDCNLAHLFKRNKEDWYSESEIMKEILHLHPHHLGIRIDTFRRRLAVLVDKDIIIESRK